MMMSEIMSNFFQFAYVTNNFEQGLDYLKDFYDLPFWEEMRNVKLDNIILNGKPDDFTTHIGFAMCGDINIELICPVKGNTAFYKTEAWRDDTFVCYPHHFAADVGNTQAELEAAIACAAKKGARKILSANFSNLGNIAFVDVQPSMGCYLELITLSDQGRAWFATVKAKF